MLADAPAFSGFSTNQIAASKTFYADTLGLDVTEENGMLSIRLGGGGTVMIYPKDDHTPASYTCLNFAVADIDAAVDGLTERGVRFERYDAFPQDERGIARDPRGPAIAWFTDPGGNIIAVLEDASRAAG